MGILDFFQKMSGKDNTQPLKVSIATNVGKIRQANEDNYYADSLGTRPSENHSEHHEINESSRYVFAVCDGMGGEEFGDEASEIAVNTLKEYAGSFRTCTIEDVPAIVNEYATEANNRICRMDEERMANLSGSTLAMAFVDGTNAYVFSIGDSRVYYFSDDELTQITEDQTLAMKKLKANIYTEEEAKNSDDAHKITTFLGVDARGIGLKAQVYPPVDLSQGAVLICSDGLTDMCSDQEIADILKRNKKHPASDLVSRALKNGGRDNITCIVITA